MPTTNKDLMRVIKKAERVCKAASIAAADVDAYMREWTDSKLMPPPFWLSQDLRSAADLAYGMSYKLTMYAHSHLPKREEKK